MEGWDHSLGNDSCPEAAGRGLVPAAVKDQWHLTGSADIQVLADDFFKEHAASHRPVQYLGQREFRLENGNLVTVAGVAIAGFVGMRQQPQPLP